MAIPAVQCDDGIVAVSDMNAPSPLQPHQADLYTEHCAACSSQTQTARVYQNADSSLSKHEDFFCCRSEKNLKSNEEKKPLKKKKQWN